MAKTYAKSTISYESAAKMVAAAIAKAERIVALDRLENPS